MLQNLAQSQNAHGSINSTRQHRLSPGSMPGLSFGVKPGMTGWVLTHRPLSSSFSGLPSMILNINHTKELLRGLWVITRDGMKDGQDSR